MGILLSSGNCDCLAVSRLDVLALWLEGTCHEGLFAPCPSKLAEKATLCPWLLSICVGVAENTFPHRCWMILGL